MRIMGFVAIVGVIALGALLLGFWGSGWTKGDVKKMAGTAQEKFAQIKGNAEAVIEAATA
ncbi:MAG: hypothetical protein ACYC3S_13985 [Chloroflexota bacterium]